jgi:hypothetical protein
MRDIRNNIMAHQMLWNFLKKVRVTIRHIASVITALTAIALLTGCAASSRMEPSMQLRTSTPQHEAKKHLEGAGKTVADIPQEASEPAPSPKSALVEE